MTRWEFKLPKSFVMLFKIFLSNKVNFHISQIILGFWLGHIYDELEDRHLTCFFGSSLYKADMFHAVLCLFGNRSQKMSKCGKNISDTLGYCLMCHFFVRITLWRHLWSITEQVHGNMESICLIETRVEVWENEKCCGNTRCRHFFEFSQTFLSFPNL